MLQSLNLWYACRVHVCKLYLYFMLITILSQCQCTMYIRLKLHVHVHFLISCIFFCLSFSSCLIDNGAKLPLSVCVYSSGVLCLCVTDTCNECLKLKPYIQLLLWKCRHKNMICCIRDYMYSYYVHSMNNLWLYF